MIAADEERMIVFGENGTYEIKKLADEIYTLSAVDTELICTTGTSKVKIGTYDTIRKAVKFSGEPVEGLEAAAAGI